MTTDYTLPKAELGAPIRVSPFIRFCRWSLLITGIAYGVQRQRTLKKRETEHRIKLRQQKIIWDEEQKTLKAKANRDELMYLAKETNTPIPADFDTQYPQ